MYADIEFGSTDDVRRFIKSVITKGVISGDINPGEYMIIDDDGIMIGNDRDFDSDVLLYAINIDDIVNFNKVSQFDDFVDSSVKDNYFKKIL